MPFSFRELESILMDQLRLYHHPIAVTWLFTDEEVEEFKRRAPYVTPIKPLTFCQWETAARMQGKTVLGTAETLACTNSQVSFGWREIDEKEVKSQLKYCVDEAQTERFLRSKPHMPMNSLKAVAVGPLGEAVLSPHVIHFYCDSVQAYHLAVDYMAATDTHPLRPQITMSSSACGGSVFAGSRRHSITARLVPAHITRARPSAEKPMYSSPASIWRPWWPACSSALKKAAPAP